jgi:putative DNA methylase
VRASGKKLIEVSLPLEVINAEGRRDKSLNRKHPKSLHWWWARRPLAVCRAIVFSQLVDDPSAHPDRFPTEDDQERERKRLFVLLEQLVAWENSTNQKLLEQARAEMERSMGGELPTVIDPFCGGGSIPVEARRLGLRALGSDLNPVAAMITKAMIEIPVPFEGRAPICPVENDTLGQTESWPGYAGLAADVLFYGESLIEAVRQQVGHLYEPAGEVEIGEIPLAWLWARTVKCPNPGCGGVIPMVNAFTLKPAKRTKSGVDPAIWARPIRGDDKSFVRFEIAEGGNPPDGTVDGDDIRCLLCERPTDAGYVKQEGSAGRMGRQLVAVVVTDGIRRYFRGSNMRPTLEPDKQAPLLTEEVPFHPQYLQLPRYGFTTFDAFFTSRQLELIKSLLKNLPLVVERAQTRGSSAEYAKAIRVYLAFLIDRIANRNSAQSFWNPGGGKVEAATSNNYMPMKWFFAEANPFAGASGSAVGQLMFLAGAIASLPTGPPGTAEQLDATAVEWPMGSVFSTDPPYYASIPYADLSDFYYVIMKRALSSDFPDVFSTVLTPKTSELVADVTRHGGDEGAAAFFRKGFQAAFDKMMAASRPDVPLVLYYAVKQQEGKGEAGPISGWEQMLQGLIDAGLQITATWPMHTEQRGGLRSYRRNALASSIVITARRRQPHAPVATRREFRDQLRATLPESLRRLQQAVIAPVDLAQASIGPGMAVFSQFSKVVEAEGTPMRVGTALGIINQVLSEVLTEQEDEYDPQTRWAVAWFEQHGMEDGAYGDAEVLSKAKATALNVMTTDGFVRAKANKVALVPRAELPDDWDPLTDPRVTVWEVTQYLIRALETGGEGAAAELVRRVGSLGEIARDLAYRLYDACERKKWADDAMAYNSLVVAWPEIVRLAAREPADVQESLLEE